MYYARIDFKYLKSLWNAHVVIGEIWFFGIPFKDKLDFKTAKFLSGESASERLHLV